MDIAKFKKDFPAFKDLDDSIIEDKSLEALCYFNACSSACSNKLQELLTAHLLYLMEQLNKGVTSDRLVQSATIDKVSVTYATSNNDSAGGNSWYSKSPYGMQFLVLNKRCNGLGKYYGGSIERQRFPK